MKAPVPVDVASTCSSANARRRLIAALAALIVADLKLEGSSPDGTARGNVQPQLGEGRPYTIR